MGGKAWQGIIVTLTVMSLSLSCAGQSPYTTTGAALGGGLGALTGAAIDSRNPWRGAAIGGIIGGVGGAVAGETMGRSRYPQQGYYNQPYYGCYDSQPYDHRHGYNDGYQLPPSNNNYGRPYPPPGYRSYPPSVAQRPEYAY